MKHKHIFQPNFVDTKSFKRGYVWRCFYCGNLRKTTPQEYKKNEEKA